MSRSSSTQCPLCSQSRVIAELTSNEPACPGCRVLRFLVTQGQHDADASRTSDLHDLLSQVPFTRHWDKVLGEAGRLRRDAILVSLPDEIRNVLRLRLDFQLPYERIAAVQQRSVNAVRMAYNRGVAMLVGPGAA